jgi:DnaK suppressor protein
LDIVKFKNLLETQKKELQQVLEDMQNEIEGISRCEAKDDLDFASYSNDASRDFILYNNQVKELQEVNYALSKVADGTYGICEMCDTEIAEERLEIKPQAQYCVECKTMMMKGKL